MVDYDLVPAYYQKEIVLTKEALNQLKASKKIALFAAVQFIKLDALITQLKDQGNEVLTTHGKRTSGKFQLLGCDCFSDSFQDKDTLNKADTILYIGDGLFHPRALILAQDKPVILYDPIAETIKTVSKKDLQKDLNKRKANIIKYLDAKNVGILVSTKPGQQYLKNAILLKNKEKDKTCYIFIADAFSFSEMENFPFIDVWVNTACPRIGYDDAKNLPRPLININDALNPEKSLQET